MEPIKITAYLASAIAVSDDFSPALDSLLQWLWLDARGLANPNPNVSEIIQAPIPLEQGELMSEWYWKVSSPHYSILGEQTAHFRKRWDTHDVALNWGKRRGKFSGSEGPEKSYDLPLYLRTAYSLIWYAVGDADEVRLLLANCRGIGKKRSQGHGQILNWEVSAYPYDYHLWGPQQQLMRPMPTRILGKKVPSSDGFLLLNWGWRPPAWHTANKALCTMPINNIQRMANG